MASGLELVPITSQKHDPAWKHCQMFKNGDRVHLKCVYCLKIFKGGGIHRIKEHLACLKGNAATCLRVPADVRLEMQQSLDGVAVKKRKKQGIAEETRNIKPIATVFDQFAANQSDANTGLHLVGSPNTPEPNSCLLVDRRSNTSGDRRKKDFGGISSADANALDIDTTGPGDKNVNEYLHMAIGRFLYDIGAPLDAMNSFYFQPMVEAILSAGSGIVAPSCHDLRGWILKNSVEEVKDDIHKIMATWSKTGCSILLDQLNTETGRTLLIVSVYCPEGTVFFKSVDTSAIIKSSEDLYELLKQVVEEVGERHVLQVLINGEEQYVVAGRRLTDTFPNLYWSPCATHSVDLILEDFAKLEWINETIEQAKSITRFVYNHSVVLNMVRRFTFGNDIVEPGLTYFATSFSTIKRMVDLKHNLQSMVTSQDWMNCPFSKKAGGLEMLDIVSNQSFWSSCDLILRLTNPLLRVLRIVRNEKRPSMGYIYAGMYRAKETIKKELVKREDYMAYWNIIDHWWAQHWHNPLHAAGFYLNPKFFYSIEGDMPGDILSRMFDCIERLVPDIKVQDKISKEINSYKNAVGDFGRKIAIRAKDTLLPAEWWSTYGGSCPNLARLAVRVLSQTCGSTGYRRNQILFEQIPLTKNCLERQRVSDLVFVQKNLRLRQMLDKNREQNSDPLSYDCISLVEDWINCMGDYGSSDWTTIELPSVNPMLLGPPNDEFEDLGAGFGDYELFHSQVKEDEEENVE